MIKNCDLFVFYDEVKYTKNDWRNRNQVCSINGNHWITIPISSESVKLKISEVKLDYSENWRESHCSLLKFCYGKSEFYSTQIIPYVMKLIRHETNSLSLLNIKAITELSSLMGIKTKFINSNQLNLIDGKVERLISTLKQVGATEYISGPAAINYLAGSEDLFIKEGIKLKFHSYQNINQYQNSGKEWSSNLSIIDLIANVGFEDAANYF